MELKNIRLHFKKWHDKTNKDFDDFTLEENILHEFDELINDRDKARKEKSQLNIENAFVIQDRNKAVSLLEDMGSFIKWSENDFSIHIDSVLHHKIKDIIKANSPDKE